MANRITYQVGYQVDKTALNEIKASLQSLQKLTSSDLMNLNRNMSLPEVNVQLQQIKKSASEVSDALSRSFNTDLGTLNISKFNNELKSLDINRIYRDFSSAGAAGQSAFRNITSQVLTTNMQLKQTHSLLDSMAVTMKNTIKWSISSAVMNSFTGSIQQAYGYVKNLDRSLNDIRIVTNKSAEDMADFAIQANKAAQSLAASTTDYTNASLIYYQQGLEDEEVAARTEVTLKAANVTQQDTAEVSEQLTAVWNGYKVSAQEAELYVDKLAAVAASTASDLEELSTGMSRVASAAALMGVDVDQLNAQLSTIISVTRQAPESVGTALRSIYARMSDIEAGIDEETTLGSYTEEMDKYGINVLNAKNELRDMGEVIEEVGSKWANMSREQQVALSQAMAGTRQYNNLLALFDNWDNYSKAIETSRNAVGTLQEQQDIYMEGTQAHLRQLKTAQEDLFDSFLDSNTINTFADGMTTVVKLMTNFVDAVGGGGNTLLTLGSIAGNVFSKQIAQGLAITITNFQNAQYNAKQLAAEIETLGKIQNSKAMQDPGIAAIVEAKNQLQQYYALLSPEQMNQGNGLIQELARAKDLQLQWEANIKAAVQYSQALMQANQDGTRISSLKDLDFTRATETAEKVQLSLAGAAEEAQRLASRVEEYNVALQNYNPNISDQDWTSVWNSLERCVEAATELADRTDLSDAAVERLKNALNSFNENNVFDYISSDFDATAANATEAETAILRLKQAITGATGEIQTNVQNANNVIDREFNASTSRGHELKQSVDGARESVERFNQSAQQTAKVQGFVRVTSAVGQCVSAFNSLINVVKIWNNEDLSAGEKTLQIMMSLSMAIPMLVSGFSTIVTQGPTVLATFLGISAAELQASVAAGTLGATLWTALAPILPIILAVSAAIGTVIGITYALVKAYNADAEAAEQAAKQVELLTNRYNECKQAAEELKNTISEYDDAITALEDLEQGTEEYSQALENANEKAKDLIKTYSLFDNYSINDKGLITIDEDALASALAEAENKVNRVAANLYTAEIASNQANLKSQSTDLSRNIGAVVGTGVTDEYGQEYRRQFNASELQAVSAALGEMDDLVYENNDALKEALEASGAVPDSVKNNINAIIENKESLLRLSDSMAEAAEANQYYAKQILGISIEENYGEDLSKIAGDNETLYNLLVSSMTEMAAKTQTDNDKALADALANINLDKSYSSNNNLNDNYGYNIQNDKDLALTYAREVLGYTDEILSYKGGINKGTVKDETGKEIVSSLSDDVMRQKLAELAEQEKVIAEIESSLGEIDADRYKEALQSLVDGANELGDEYGIELTNSILAALANGNTESFDFSSLFENLNLKDKESLEQLNTDELMSILGINEEDLIALGYESAESFHNAWTTALNEYDEDAWNEKIRNAVSSGNQEIKTLMEGVQSGDINYKNLYDEDSYNNLMDSLKAIEGEYPEIDAAVQVLSNNWEVGTQKYIEALEIVQDKLSSLNFSYLEEAANEAVETVEKLMEDVVDEEGEIKVGADTEAFEDAMNELLDREYEIDIAVHAEAEQEFESIMNAMDDIYNKADMIGENFIVAANDIRELNNTFPGIIEGMSQLADGTIQLNEDIARSAINAAEAEAAADAQAAVEKLKNQAILLRAKQQSYLQMAEAARVLAGMETDSEMDASQARATISAELANLKELNSQITAQSEMDNQQEVADSSNSNAGITAQNWAQGFQAAAIASAQFANDAIANMQAAASGSGAGTVGNYAVNYQGASGVSQEASILDQTQSALDSANDTSSDVWADLASKYQNLADSAGAAANDIEGMIAQIGATGHELDHAFDNVRSGHGTKNPKEKSSKEKDPDYMDYLEDEADRYHDINLELEDLEVHLNRLTKQQKKLYGQDLINNLNEQLDILEKQKDAYAVKLSIAKAEAQELRNSLAMQGVSFDADGYMSNYASALQSKLDYVNSVIAQYNAMSAEEQEGFKSTVEAAKEDYETFKSQMERYDELISSFIPDIEDSIQDAIDKEIEINIQKFTMEVELRLDMAEAERDFNEFQRKVVKGIKDDDILGNAQSKLKDYTSYFDTNGHGTGPIQKLTEQINDTMDQIEQIDKGGWADVYGDNKAQAMEDLQKYYEELMQQLEDIVDLVDEIKESYLDMIDEAVEAFDKQVDQYEYIKDLLDHDMNVVGLVYGDKAYAQMAQYYEKIEQNNNQELDFLKKRVAYAEEMMNKETDPKAREKWEEEWMDALEKLNDKVEDSIQNIIDKYQNAIKQTFDELNKKVTSGKGLDYVNDEWDLINKNADQYLDTINSLYAIQDLENKYLDALDQTDSLSAQQKLNDMMNEQLGMLKDKDKLTQYDVDRANMMYEIALKQIALEEAQQNKSKMRLRRDSQGNYSYQFVSDEDSIAQAQQDLLAAQNDLYNFDKEKYKENLNEIYEYYVEFQEKYAEIMSDMSLTDEERQERAKLLQEQYGELINRLVEQNETIKQNLHESTFMALEGLYANDAESFKEMTGKDIEAFRDLTDTEKDLIINDLIPQWDSAVQHMADVFAKEGGLIPTCKEAFEELDQATRDYQDSLDDLESAAGIDFDSIAAGYDENIDKAQDLLYANDDLINKYMEEIDAILDVINQLEDLIAKYEEAQAAAVAATEAAYAFVTAQKEAAAAAAAGSSGGSSSGGGSGGSGSSGSGGSGGGSSSGGGSGSGGGDGVPRVGDVVTYTGGLYYYDSYGTKPTGSRGPGKKVTITNLNPGAPKPIHVQSSDSAYGWLTQSQISGYDTGGYTGNWGDKEGRLAVLHQKELVLKDTDTENMLTAVGIVRDIAGMLDNLNASMMARVMGLSARFDIPMTGISAASDTIEQDVHIEAHFPNVQSSHEIEDALNNLVNIASQRAYKTQK